MAKKLLQLNYFIETVADAVVVKGRIEGVFAGADAEAKALKAVDDHYKKSVAEFKKQE